LVILSHDPLLFLHSGVQNEAINKKADNRTSWLLLEGVGDDQKQQPCFAEPSTKNETEIRSLQSSTCNSDSSSSTLPAWLQQYKNENNKGITYNDQVFIIPIKHTFKGTHRIPLLLVYYINISFALKLDKSLGILKNLWILIPLLLTNSLSLLPFLFRRVQTHSTSHSNHNCTKTLKLF